MGHPAECRGVLAAVVPRVGAPWDSVHAGTTTFTQMAPDHNSNFSSVRCRARRARWRECVYTMVKDCL
eukprot:356760-Chlamydomonas_euryale.AAC.3